MNTNQVLERKMGEFKVYQRTSDGMFNATSLLKQWNLFVSKHNILNTQNDGCFKKKDLDDFFGNKSTNDYIAVIQRRECLHTHKFVYVKSRASRGENAGTWVHPMLFIDLAMWINPEFKYDVIKFVHDQLIQYRNDAGDAYKDMAAAISTIVSKSLMKEVMRKIAIGLNYVIYGDHKSGMRNRVGDESKARELLELEKDITKSIRRGFISNMDQLMDFLRNEYRFKMQMPKELAS